MRVQLSLARREAKKTSPNSVRYYCEVPISGNTIITVYANDHLPPHFHAINPDDEALIEIATLTILRGDLRPATRRKVLEWAAANHQAIVAEWNRLNPRFPVG